MNCYLTNPHPPDGGGSCTDGNGSIVVRRSLAIGDCIAATVVVDKLVERGFPVTFQSHPHMHCVLRRHPSIAACTVPNGFAHINLDGAYERNPHRRQRHFHAMFLASAQEQLYSQGIDLGALVNCRPTLIVPQGTRSKWAEHFGVYPRPWIFICPRSQSWANRTIPDAVWAQAMQGMNGTRFWIGRHPAPPNCIDLTARHLDNVIEWLAVADLLVTVDTGPMHIAAALGTPVVAIEQSSSPELHLSDQSDFVTLRHPSLKCLNCQESICPINRGHPPCQDFPPELIKDAVNRRLGAYFGQSVSAVVPIYRPRVELLNQCLDALIPQVNEIVVPMEANSVKPAGAREHPKIRYVKTFKRSIGYSGNANFGARHTNSNWILFSNDDAILKPDAVAKMMECVKPDTGMVSNLLRYPSGMIYHAGKVRSPGMRGWGHLDLNQRDHTLKDVTEVENCCGCVVLVRRKAFYEASGFDEELPIFAQDDAFSIMLRRNGWKILFTPFSEGVHWEHQTINKLANTIPQLLAVHNATFGRKYGEYLEWNLNRVPGNFDYLKL